VRMMNDIIKNLKKIEKQRKKYKKLWGEEFYNNLMILNEADKSAK